MKTNPFTSRSNLDGELEQALHAWIDASRLAWEPDRDPGDVQAEHAAWCRLKSVLSPADVAAAA